MVLCGVGVVVVFLGRVLVECGVGGSVWAAGVVVRMGSRLCIVVGLVGWRSPCVCVSVVADAF